MRGTVTSGAGEHLAQSLTDLYLSQFQGGFLRYTCGQLKHDSKTFEM